MRQKRCIAVLGLHGKDWGLNLGPGQIVDLDAMVGGGVRLADAVAGREDCFEDIGPEAHVAPPQADVEDDASQE